MTTSTCLMTPLAPEDGLYDASKGKFSSFTATKLAVQKWTASARTLTEATTSDTELTSLTSTTSCAKTAILRVTGFQSAGAGKLIGPNGNEQDTEEFLASFTLWTTASTTCKSGSTYYDTTNAPVRTVADSSNAQPVPVLFRIVTQKYGQGIVFWINKTNFDYYSRW